MQLKDARILLTGATGGLGAALAAALTAQGAQLVLCGRDVQRLRRLRDTLGGTAHCVCGDLTRGHELDAVAVAAADFGVDMLVNNAGVGDYGMLLHRDRDAIDAVLQTNLLAPVRLTHALLPHLLRREQPAVVNIGSIFGSLPFAGFAAYSASKAGLRGFSQALRRETADSALRVFYIAPRAIDTAMNSDRVHRLNAALGNAQDAPDAVARHVVHALRHDHHEVHLGFPERLFAWINGLNPGWIDRGVAGKLKAIKEFSLEDGR